MLTTDIFLLIEWNVCAVLIQFVLQGVGRFHSACKGCCCVNVHQGLGEGVTVHLGMDGASDVCCWLVLVMLIPSAGEWLVKCPPSPVGHFLVALVSGLFSALVDVLGSSVAFSEGFHDNAFIPEFWIEDIVFVGTINCHLE